MQNVFYIVCNWWYKLFPEYFLFFFLTPDNMAKFVRVQLKFALAIFIFINSIKNLRRQIHLCFKDNYVEFSQIYFNFFFKQLYFSATIGMERFTSNKFFLKLLKFPFQNWPKHRVKKNKQIYQHFFKCKQVKKWPFWKKYDSVIDAKRCSITTNQTWLLH